MSRKASESCGVARAAVVVLAGLMALAGSGCTREQGTQGTEVASGTVPSTPEELLSELREQRSRIDQAADRMRERIAEFNRTRRPDQQEIAFSDVFFDDLSSEQRDVLNELIAEEKNSSYQALLEQIVQERDTIEALQDRIRQLERTLPDPFVVAKQGDSHHALAMDYLVHTAGLGTTRAEEVLRDVDRTEILLPGNKVWFFYDPDREFFRTYVTQGAASQTPLAVRLAANRRITTERDEATTRANKLMDDKIQLVGNLTELQKELAALEKERRMLETEVAGLRSTRDSLRDRVGELRADLEHLENSLFYHTATQDDLRQQKVLTRVRKEVRDIQGIPFREEIDLRDSRRITVRADDLGLDAIKGVRVLPSIYVEGRDYTIERSEDGATVDVVIHQQDIFRGKEVLLSVRG